MIVCGIDPGTAGAYAILEKDKIVAVDDLPVFKAAKRGTKAELNLSQLFDILNRYALDHVILEQVHAMPKQGVASTFRFGYAAGAIAGLVAGLQLPVTFVVPQIWQKAMSCGRLGEQARQRAVQLFPGAADKLARKKDEHRADAILLACYGLRL